MSTYGPTSASDQLAVAESQPRGRPTGNARLIAWVGLVAVLAGLSFAANAFLSAQPDDLDYRYSSALGGIIFYAVILGLVLLIARGLPRKETFALNRPRSWPRTLGLILGTLVATYLQLAVVSSALGPASDVNQGIATFWDSSRATQFALNFAVTAVLAPIVEELTFRGLGFSLLSKFGAKTALFGTAVLFGLTHGFLIALPLFVTVGLALGWLRMRTGSVYPGMIMHGVLNAVATILAVSLGP
jgi:membrane protease YdiL (CAAX protease family)